MVRPIIPARAAIAQPKQNLHPKIPNSLSNNSSSLPVNKEKQLINRVSPRIQTTNLIKRNNFIIEDQLNRKKATQQQNENLNLKKLK